MKPRKFEGCGGILKAAIISAVMMAGNASHALIVGPYTSDASTLHLWHMDEPAVPAVDSAVGGTNLTAIANGATLNNASFSGFGTALSTVDGGQSGITATDKDAYLAPRPLVNGTGDNTSLTYADPVTGAFTMEAIVRIDFDPAINFNTVPNGGNGRNAQMQLLNGEDEVNGNRIWQFRVLPIGTLANNTAVSLEFINLNKAVSVQSLVVPIPTVGADAIVSNGWYHVAITYDGNAGVADNFKFYWTLLDPSRTSANLIGSTTMNLDLAAGVPDFAIGNIGRNPIGGNFVGLIDEVRICKTAKSAADMMFTSANVAVVANPVSVTVAVGQLASFSVTASGQNPKGYQWRLDGANIPGANQSVYTIAAAQLADDGDYDVVITNGVSSATSSVAVLTVRTALNLAWLGISGFDWDTTTFNWINTNTLANVAYTTGDNIVLDDQGAANPIINLTTALSPSAIVVDGTIDYWIEHAGQRGDSGNFETDQARDWNPDSRYRQFLYRPDGD